MQSSTKVQPNSIEPSLPKNKPVRTIAVGMFCYIWGMTEATYIKDTLKKIKPILADKYHVSAIGLFGSVVRDDYSPTLSDIDIIVDFSRPIGIEFVDLADYLEKILNKKVDLVSKKGIKSKYFAHIEPEIVYV
jgi:predicted nucleotidyltransferase